MTQNSLADRFINYRDAVAAFSVVNAVAFLIALSELEVRCSLSQTGPIFILVFPLWASAQSGLLLVCWWAERTLRTPEESQPAPVARVLRHLDFARHGLVWGITLLTMAIAISAGNDPACR